MWDKIARTGTFKALNGKDYTFTRDKFEMIAKNYKGATEKAPIVLGHPSTDDPALGWVKELRVNGDYLEASYEDVSPELKSDVELGRYRYKSMALYPDLQRLKHIGFLGAVPPAIDNLGIIGLSADDNLVSFAFDGNINKENKPMDEKLAELLQKAQEEIAVLKSRLAKLEDKLLSTESEKKEAETKLESTETNFAKFKNDVEVARRVSKVDSLIKEGKVMPSEKEDVLKLASVFSSASFSGGSETEELFWKRYEAKDSNLLAEFTQPKEDRTSATIDITSKM